MIETTVKQMLDAFIGHCALKGYPPRLRVKPGELRMISNWKDRDRRYESVVRTPLALWDARLILDETRSVFDELRVKQRNGETVITLNIDKALADVLTGKELQ